jgi:hypothetical protein
MIFFLSSQSVYDFNHNLQDILPTTWYNNINNNNFNMLSYKFYTISSYQL